MKKNKEPAGFQQKDQEASSAGLAFQCCVPASPALSPSLPAMVGVSAHTATPAAEGKTQRSCGWLIMLHR